MKWIGCGSIDDDVMSRNPRLYLPWDILIPGRIGNREASEIQPRTFAATGSCDLVAASKQLPNGCITDMPGGAKNEYIH
jgi:hypothetical protein